jgi:hypothetical protein
MADHLGPLIPEERNACLAEVLNDYGACCSFMSDFYGRTWRSRATLIALYCHLAVAAGTWGANGCRS